MKSTNVSIVLIVFVMTFLCFSVMAQEQEEEMTELRRAATALFEVSVYLEMYFPNILSEEDNANLARNFRMSLNTVLQLADPYAVLMAPAFAADFQEQVTGEYGGIGAMMSNPEMGLMENQAMEILLDFCGDRKSLDIMAKVAGLENPEFLKNLLKELDPELYDKILLSLVGDRGLFVNEVMSGSSAESSGLKAGEYVLKINGQSVVGMPFNDAISLIKGPAGTDVVLTLFDGNDEKRVAIVKRELIEIQAVSYKSLSGTVGYIQLKSFTSDHVIDQLREAVLAMNDLPSLIIDLRENRGGQLGQAIKTLELFLPGESPAVVSDSVFTGRVGYKTRENRQMYSKPLIILVDENTASASEVVAGALQEHHRAVVIGENTYGKGSMQEILPLESSGYDFKITVGNWFLPSGGSVDGYGIIPDLLIYDDPETENDEVLEEALSLLQE